MRATLLGILIGLLLASVALALHGHWQDHYTDAKGMACYGRRDCQPTHLRVVALTQEWVMLEIAGTFLVHLPPAAFHHSEDLQDWVCLKEVGHPPTTENIRCAFVAIGS